MLKTLITAFALLCLLTINSEARQRTSAAHPDCNLPGPNSMPCQDVGPSPRGEMVRKALGGLGSARPVYTPRSNLKEKLTGSRRSVVRDSLTGRKTRFGHGVFTEEIGQKANKNGRFLEDSHLKEITHQDTYSGAVGFADAMSRPARYISGRLRCAVNVGAALAERGIKGTGSALALSYLRWGHSAGGPVPGAVIVSARRGGGHVAIVSRVENGVVYAWNASGGQRGWREIPYRHRILDYRVPG